MQKSIRLLRFLPVLAIFLFSVSLLSAASLTVVDPVQKTLQGGQELDLGIAGPGQKIVIQSMRESGQLSGNSANPTDALWDRVIVENIPADWSSEPSKLYETPFQTFVTISPQAPDGQYQFSVRTLDEYDGLVPIVLDAKIQVARNVLAASLSESRQTAGVQQPAFYYITLSNTGSASDIFEISPSGLPAKWAESRRVFVPHNSAVTLSYPITATEGGAYGFSFNVTSLSSPLIQQRVDAHLDAQTSIWNDAKAASHGIALFPFIAQPLYALIGFLSNLF